MASNVRLDLLPFVEDTLFGILPIDLILLVEKEIISFSVDFFSQEEIKWILDTQKKFGAVGFGNTSCWLEIYKYLPKHCDLISTNYIGRIPEEGEFYSHKYMISDYLAKSFFASCSRALSPSTEHDLSSRNRSIYSDKGEIMNRCFIDVKSLFLLMRRRFEICGIENVRYLAGVITKNFLEEVCNLYLGREALLEMYLYVCVIIFNRGNETVREFSSTSLTFEEVQSKTFSKKISNYLDILREEIDKLISN